MPKVSIIVPCYKVEKYLDRCIESLTNQTLKDIEIILVDDLSPDKTPLKCDEWASRDSRIKVVHKIKNEGLGYSRNTGLEIAKGEYIAFVDSDDFVDSSMYEYLYGECSVNQLDCVYSEFNADDYPGFRVVSRPERIYVGRDEIELLRLDIVGAEPSFISSVKYHCSSCKSLYSLKLIREHNLKFLSERQYISEDLLFNLDFLYYANRVKTVSWQFYHYCLNATSLTHTYRADRWDKMLVMLNLLEDEKKYNNKGELALRVKRTAIFYSMGAIKQEKKRDHTSFMCKYNRAREIVNNPLLRNYLLGYPIYKLPIKWMVYTYLLKYRITALLYILV